MTVLDFILFAYFIVGLIVVLSILFEEPESDIHLLAKLLAREIEAEQWKAVDKKLRKSLRKAGVPVNAKKPTNSVKPWSRKFACCMECGRTDRPHHARGLCRHCRNQVYIRPQYR